MSFTLAIKNRKSRIEVGKGLEAVYPDIYAKRALDGAKSFFRSNDFYGGINQVVDDIISKTTIKPEKTEEISTVGNQEKSKNSYSLLFYIVPFLSALGIFLYFFYKREFAQAKKAYDEDKKMSQEKLYGTNITEGNSDYSRNFYNSYFVPKTKGKNIRKPTKYKKMKDDSSEISTAIIAGSVLSHSREDDDNRRSSSSSSYDSSSGFGGFGGGDFGGGGSSSDW